MKLILLSLVTLFSFSSFCAADDTKTAKEYKTKHVIILVIDGPRWSETYGDTTYQNVPNMKYKLAPQGVFFNNFTNEGPTYTLSGHTALTTGVYQKLENSGKAIPKNPSIFQYYLKQYKADKRKAWVLASKGKLNVLGQTKNKEWLRQYYPSVYAGTNGSGLGYPSDKKMWPIFAEIINHQVPAISIINLLEADAWAHQKNWDRYISSIKQNDEIALKCWQLIQRHPQLKDNTTLFITNDHGRHLDDVKDGFVSHGDKCEGCKHISLIGLGPDFKTNTVIDNQYDLIDINATAAELLHIDMPTAKGNVIWEMIKSEQ